jgi:hypothetical protein
MRPVCWRVFSIWIIVMAIPVASYADRVCEESGERLRTIEGTKFSWDGETLSARFFYIYSSDSVMLAYRDESGKEETRFSSGLGMRDGNTWVTEYFQLPYKPSSARMVYLENYCVRSREKTFWEKLESF